jgi:predicted RNA binding protein YcfA (HicA-like mRNA interferase family)
MSPKLPVLSGDDLIKALKKFGYEPVRQEGSHVRLRHTAEPQRHPLTVPRHRTLKPGLLRRILRDARISVQDLSNAL